MPYRDPERRREASRRIMRRWRAANPERAREIDRRYEARRHRDPEARRAYNQQYYAKNRDRIRAVERAKYAADPEPILTVNRASYARHRTKRIAYARAYRRKIERRFKWQTANA